MSILRETHPRFASDLESLSDDDGQWSTVIPDPNTCTVLHNSRNFSNYLTGKYEGVPENLLVNVVGWLFLILLFAFLRKKAWHYGRIALVQKCDHRWTNLFYGENTATSAHCLSNDVDSIDSFDISLHVDKGFCSWLKAIFKIKDDHIMRKVGRDAVQYLSFQRYLIIYLCIVCVISLSIALPINFNGNLRGDQKEFGHTTLSNLDPKSPLIWVHVVLSFLFLPLGIFFMRHYSRNLKIEEEESLVGRTLMIHGIPKEHCQRNTLMQHFQEAYPECEICDIQFAYDVRKLVQLDAQREAATHARLWCESYVKESGLHLRMRPFRCGRVCACCGCRQVDALEYYSEEEHALITAVDREQASALTRPVGIAFLTFQSESMAEMVYKDHLERWKCTTNPPSSSLSRVLNPHEWEISFAPSPEDIVWENMSVDKGRWYVRAVFVNVLLFVALLFVSTPAFVLNGLNLLYEALKWEPKGVFFSEILPSFIMLGSSAVLPVIVSYSDEFICHWTKSGKNHAIMQKTFIFLLCMVIFLPSLGLTSISAAFQQIVKPHNQTFKWQCIFLPDNGAFFVNYVITSGFVGTALELIRFPELTLYVFYLAISRSRAEQSAIQKANIWEFAFGVQYAWILLIFSLVMVYSLTCPLITPFGLVYMCLKHLVDRYNICFVYSPSKINKSIHAAAINYVVVALLLLQVSLFIFSLIRVGWSNHTIASLIICLVMLMVFLAQVSLDWFQHLSPIAYKKLSHQDGSLSGEQLSDRVEPSSPTRHESDSFVPVILRKPSFRGEVYTTTGRTYGSNEDSVPVSPERNNSVDRQQVAADVPGDDTTANADTEYLYQRY